MRTARHGVSVMSLIDNDVLFQPNEVNSVVIYYDTDAAVLDVSDSVRLGVSMAITIANQG